MPIVLLYHDVVPPGGGASSGFTGAGADRYKLTEPQFKAHLDAIAALVSAAPLSPGDLFRSDVGPASWALSFDDGGASAIATADMLETKGWRGCFFVATDFVDRPAFLTKQQIRQLHRRGHGIGSHSASHPSRISSLPTDGLLAEWNVSRRILEDILGEAVVAASVPNGFYSRRVARAVIAAGYQTLFNSEPTAHVTRLEGCRVIGRFSLQQHSPASLAGALAQGKLLPRLRQRGSWKARKVAKSLAGEAYLRMRSWWLERKRSPEARG